MSEIQQASEDKFVTLKGYLLQMPKSIKSFSQSMRSLYADKAVGTSTDAARKFRKLRDETRHNALLYLESILPVTTKFVMVLEDHFGTYDALSFEEWCEMLPDIQEEMTSHKELAQTVVTMHNELITPLKKCEDEAKIILTEFKDLQATSEKKAEASQGSAESRNMKEVIFDFARRQIPKCRICGVNGEDNMANVFPKEAEPEIYEDAAALVTKTLIPALADFIDGLIKAAKLFEVIESDLPSMVEITDETIDTRRHSFTGVKNEAKDLKSLCKAFFAVLPDVRTDFQAIPAEETHQNIVEKSLEESKETTFCNE